VERRPAGLPSSAARPRHVRRRNSVTHARHRNADLTVIEGFIVHIHIWYLLGAAAFIISKQQLLLEFLRNDDRGSFVQVYAVRPP
jgi:hypothetical protein